MEVEDVGDFALKPFGPQMDACCTFDKLSGYANAITGTADASLEQVANP